MSEQNKEQILLYQNRRKIKNSIRPLVLEKYHFDFIFYFLNKNKKSIIWVLILVFIQALFEVALLFIIGNSSREYIYTMIRTQTFLFFIFTIFISVSLYLYITYIALKYEREIVIKLINNLRERLFSNILQKKTRQVTNEKKSEFIAKISYHLPLLSLGIDHSIFGCIKWFLFTTILLVLGFITGSYMIYLVFGIIFLSIFILLIAYFIAYNFISQEVTAYSQIIKHISTTLSEFDSLKDFHQEKLAVSNLRTMVDVDTYFRVRRDIWLRYLNRILFAALFVISIFIVALTFSYPEFFSWFYGSSNKILTGIISLYAIRLFYEAVQVGLYLPPVKLGIFLCVPKNTFKHLTLKLKIPWQNLTFKSTKTKLFQESNYFKKISLFFEKGKSYLITGEVQSGKTSLAYVLSGFPQFNPTGWLVKVDEHRFNMNTYTKKFFDLYFFKPQFKSQKTLGELILNKEIQNITENDITEIYSLCERYPIFLKTLSQKRFIGDSILAFQNNDSALFAIQTLYCIVNKISLIIIDNKWVDTQYREIHSMIQIMDKELSSSTIIICAREKNDIINYEKIYEIKEKQIV